MEKDGKGREAGGKEKAIVRGGEAGGRDVLTPPSNFPTPPAYIPERICFIDKKDFARLWSNKPSRKQR